LSDGRKQPTAIGLLEYVLYIALIIPVVYGLRYVDGLSCPADAFICGGASWRTTGWAGLLRVVLTVLALVYPVKILLYAATRNHWLRRKFDSYYKRFNLRATALRAVAAAGLLVPAMLLLTFDRIWATASVIAERRYVWSAPVTRGWGDVVAVSTSCRRGSRGSWYHGYDLTFRDGGHVDLGMNIGPITDHRAAIVAALHGRRFDFDASDVDRYCPADFRDMATTRP
jgi:hypothetical protein